MYHKSSSSKQYIDLKIKWEPTFLFSNYYVISKILNCDIAKSNLKQNKYVQICKTVLKSRWKFNL